ncbi:hypothetical protein ABN763_09720 [Spongiivirga sp. MCCC 1A20706]|uniref:hypothetical protein n=1 Tax=Spongiivirga sp. MCCC 1A20706 TaxID=3160963 RepID=UPI003977B727
MKKILNKSLLSMLAGSLLIITSCDSDALVDDVVDGTTRGAVLRTRASSGSFDMFRTGDSFNLTLEEQDRQGGELLDRVEVLLTYDDNNDQNGDDSAELVQIAVLPASAFNTNDRGFPETDYSFTLQEALTTLNITLTDVLPGDRVLVDLVLYLTDGRTFGSDNSAGTVTGGSFYASPFQYILTVDDGIDFEIDDGESTNEIDLTEGEVIEDYSVTITIDDDEDGVQIQTLNVYREFLDRTIGDDGTNLSEDEALFDTVAAADLTNDDGVLSTTFTYTIADLLGDDLTEDDLAVGDQFRIRYELVTADGRVVTTDEIDSEYFDTIDTSACVQLNLDAPVPGEYTVVMNDSYGDGWNGGFITVTIDGGEGLRFSVTEGEDETQKFTVPDGATSLVVTYTNGDWDDENSFNIVAPNGNSAASEGPFPRDNDAPPVATVIELKVCE